jgi:hypothetical protein
MTDRLVNSNRNFKASPWLHFQGPAIKEKATVWPCKRKSCFLKLKTRNYNSIVHSKEWDISDNWQTFEPVVKITSMSVYLCLMTINTLNTVLNPICHFPSLLGAHHIFHVSRIRVNDILSLPSKAFQVFACKNLGFVLWGFKSYEMLPCTVG